ncbi:hypothetical protein K438DRAFT_1755982 [Mycena galopus ATCC 62051]|nr:hypothetical protein K438DRAFT_1755982 [Mycena galopus ATCC 62051]
MNPALCCSLEQSPWLELLLLLLLWSGGPSHTAAQIPCVYYVRFVIRLLETGTPQSGYLMGGRNEKSKRRNTGRPTPSTVAGPYQRPSTNKYPACTFYVFLSQLPAFVHLLSELVRKRRSRCSSFNPDDGRQRNKGKDDLRFLFRPSVRVNESIPNPSAASARTVFRVQPPAYHKINPDSWLNKVRFLYFLRCRPPLTANVGGYHWRRMLLCGHSDPEIPAWLFPTDVFNFGLPLVTSKLAILRGTGSSHPPRYSALRLSLSTLFSGSGDSTSDLDQDARRRACGPARPLTTADGMASVGAVGYRYGTRRVFDLAFEGAIYHRAGRHTPIAPGNSA